MIFSFLKPLYFYNPLFPQITKKLACGQIFVVLFVKIERFDDRSIFNTNLQEIWQEFNNVISFRFHRDLNENGWIFSSFIIFSLLTNSS